MLTTVLTEKLNLAVEKGNDHIRAARYEQAVTHYETLLIFVDESTPHYLRCCYTNLGMSCRALGRVEEALSYYIKALDVRVDDDFTTNAIRAHIGNALVDQGHAAQALDFLSPAETYFRGQFSRYQLAEVLETKARALLAINEKHLALAAALESVNIYYPFVMDREATNKDHSKAFGRAVNTLAVCTVEFRCGSGVNAERF
jgi:tetratricopeptide (TPR) repeat protein